MYIVGMNTPNFKGSMAVIYAPIAGVSDSPSRKIAREMGADMTVSELISAEGVIRNGARTMELARFHDAERPFGIQLFGAKPDSMARAAEIMKKHNPDFIDLNFGCPARKVVGKNGGSSVLRNLKLLKEIVEKVVDAVDIPVTVKMRSGWDDSSMVYLDAGRMAEECGAQAVTLHPRTRVQGFAGKADWSQIRELKEALDIAVIGNGDIVGPKDACRMFDETGCDAIMVGRASFGNPWVFKRIKGYLEFGEIQPEPGPKERIEMAVRHLELTINYYGLPRGIYRMRSRLGWYIRGLPGASKIRPILNRLDSADEIRECLFNFLHQLVSNWKANNGSIYTYLTANEAK